MAQGFITRDRRRPHVVLEDEQLAENLQETAMTDTEAEDEAGPDARAGMMLEGILVDGRQFVLLVRTLRVLVQVGQAQEAQQLTQHVMSLLSPRGEADKWVSIPAPPSVLRVCQPV
jgi:hypothetical protein